METVSQVTYILHSLEEDVFVITSVDMDGEERMKEMVTCLPGIKMLCSL